MRPRQVKQNTSAYYCLTEIQKHHNYLIRCDTRFHPEPNRAQQYKTGWVSIHYCRRNRGTEV